MRREPPNRARRSGLAVLAISCLLAAPAAAQDAGAVVIDDRGVTVRFSQRPRRIIALLPSLTESVCALGACDRLVGTDRFSNWPASVVGLPKLGGLDDAQIEHIVTLRPEMVLVSASMRVSDRLEALGVRVVVLETRNQADVKRTLQLLGHALGVPGKANEVWADIERAIDQATARVPTTLRGQRVYFEVDTTPYAASAGSFVGEMLARMGLGNVVPAELGPFPKLNPEYVVRSQPDIVMASQRALAGMAKRPGWGALRALTEHRSCGFPSDRYELLLRPGPRMGEGAQILADCAQSIATGH